jgi:hypothetical protein
MATVAGTPKGVAPPSQAYPAVPARPVTPPSQAYRLAGRR